MKKCEENYNAEYRMENILDISIEQNEEIFIENLW